VAEAECVCDFEPRGQPAPGHFRASPRDRGRRNVDAGAAASVEKASGQAALVSEPGKSRLRPADVPRAGVPAV
jgi:hypothetical protein